MKSNKSNRGKDFVYNFSDIFVAVLILLVAAGIIWWRVNVIMAYPKTLTSGNKTTASDTNSGSSSTDTSSSDSTSTDSQSNDSSSSDSASSTSASSSVYTKKGKLRADVSVSIPSGSEDAAIQVLVDAKLFADADEFRSVCQTAGVSSSSIKVGDYTFKKGSTQSDIAVQVTT